MTDATYLSETKARHFKMIDDYVQAMSTPYAQQKAVLESLLLKYKDHYRTFDSIKQTFARLKREYPERFNIVE